MENTISTLQPRKWSDMILSLIGTSLRTSCNEPEENSVVPKIIILWFTVPYHGSGYAYGKKNWSDLFLLPFLYTEKLGCQKLLAIWVTTCRTGIWFQIVSKISNILFSFGKNFGFGIPKNLIFLVKVTVLYSYTDNILWYQKSVKNTLSQYRGTTNGISLFLVNLCFRYRSKILVISHNTRPVNI